MYLVWENLFSRVYHQRGRPRPSVPSTCNGVPHAQARIEDVTGVSKLLLQVDGGIHNTTPYVGR